MIPFTLRVLVGLLATLASAVLCRAAKVQPPTGHGAKTRNVILFMSDGLRWQEVFTGADDRLMNKDNGVEHPDPLRAAYWRDTPEARRDALMPFVWGTIAKHGQIYGNMFKGSSAIITNEWKVSYPGYSEVFCGFKNPYLKDNKNIPNPEVTVFEWLHNKPEYHGRIAAFGAWEIFPAIFNTQRCGFPVDGGVGPVTFGKLNERIEAFNTLRAEVPCRWGNTTFDAMVYRAGLEWLKINKPRLMFLGMGETDEWAHEGEYDQYLTAAHRVDGYLRELWETLQSIPEYKDSTSIIVTCDHGRGGDNAPGYEGGELAKWRDHNNKVIGAEQIWIMVLGPDTPPLGERQNIQPVTQSQIAATIASLLGEDYNAAQDRAAPPIRDALPNITPQPR